MFVAKTLKKRIQKKKRYLINKITGGRFYKNKQKMYDLPVVYDVESYNIPGVYDIESYKEKLKQWQYIKYKKEDVAFVWYVPYWEHMWGGGHFTIFRFADFLSKMGNKNILYINGWNGRYKSPQQLKEEFKAAFGNDHKIEIIVDHRLIPSNHVAIATTWQSVYEVIKYSTFQKKFYFMQDYESYFYAFGTQSIQANATYELGFHGITGGTWLKECYEYHGGKANNYVFSVDKNIFFPKENLGSDIKRLFFYGRPSTERRCYELGVNILQQVSYYFPDIEILIAGLNNLKKLPFKAELLGNLTLKETGELYRTCDVGIALSATNLSYIPVELMACGVPVLTNHGKNVEWFCKDKVNSLVCDPFPSSFITALSELINSGDLRRQIVNGGLKTISQTSWEKEAKKIQSYIYQELGD